jgi:hypothetical protein
MTGYAWHLWVWARRGSWSKRLFFAICLMQER